MDGPALPTATRFAARRLQVQLTPLPARIPRRVRRIQENHRGAMTRQSAGRMQSAARQTPARARCRRASCVPHDPAPRGVCFHTLGRPRHPPTREANNHNQRTGLDCVAQCSLATILRSPHRRAALGACLGFAARGPAPEVVPARRAQAALDALDGDREYGMKSQSSVVQDVAVNPGPL